MSQILYVGPCFCIMTCIKWMFVKKKRKITIRTVFMTDFFYFFFYLCFIYPVVHFRLEVCFQCITALVYNN